VREYREDDVIASGLEFGFAFWRWYLILATSDFGPRRLYNIWLLRSPILIVSGKFCQLSYLPTVEEYLLPEWFPRRTRFNLAFFSFRPNGFPL
jgi:hypothetical protein